MGSGFQFVDIIFFALVAAFIILRLRSVLGRRNGNENPERWTARKPAPTARTEAGDNVARLPDRTRPAGEAGPVIDLPANSPAEAGLTQIKVADPSFDPRGFVEGARGAFEMIVGAYAQGDTAALRPLLADDVYENFAAAIRGRQQAKQTHETTLVGVKSADIVEARMDGRAALVTVKFISDQINVTRDANGAVIEGDPQQIAGVTDVWTFSRNTRSRDPNWLLVATSEPS
jgi:predicted lipid-binding transport protein (Tim44 family)